MEELFALGVECLKEEGVFVCLKKTLHWFFHYTVEENNDKKQLSTIYA